MDSIAADLEAIRTDANAPVETVTYTRYSGSSVLFSRTGMVVFCGIESMLRRNTYDDGRGEVEGICFSVPVEAVGSVPQIGEDKITRADGSVWVIEQVRKVLGGLAVVECVKYEGLSKSGPRSRVMR